jgi:thiosulfate/3-mercaptopyruvate sulfurtransferase
MKSLFLILLLTIESFALDAFISAKDLKHILDDEKLVIIDVSKHYNRSHILGAHKIDVSKLTKKDVIYNPLVDTEDFNEIFENLELTDESKIVIYGRNSPADIQNSAFLAFVLISYGFENVSILDGGYMAWVFEYDYFTTSKKTELDLFTTLYNLYSSFGDESEDQNIHKRECLSVDINYIVENNNTVLIDTRYPQKYYGISSKDDDIYAGHIPGAKNSHYAYKFLKDKTLRDKIELSMIYESGLGLDESSDIVVYADNVKEAAVEWYILYKHMGYKNAKLYYNSFVEYVDWGYETKRFAWE